MEVHPSRTSHTVVSRGQRRRAYALPPCSMGELSCARVTGRYARVAPRRVRRRWTGGVHCKDLWLPTTTNRDLSTGGVRPCPPSPRSRLLSAPRVGFNAKNVCPATFASSATAARAAGSNCARWLVIAASSVRTGRCPVQPSRWHTPRAALFRCSSTRRKMQDVEGRHTRVQVCRSRVG
jgi:hypothetical protein